MNLTRAEIMSLSGRDLDLAVAQSVMGQQDGGYSASWYSVAAMEQELESRGLMSEYVRELAAMILPYNRSGVYTAPSIGMLMTAAPEAKCRAALIVVMQATSFDPQPSAAATTILKNSGISLDDMAPVPRGFFVRDLNSLAEEYAAKGIDASRVRIVKGMTVISPPPTTESHACTCPNAVLMASGCKCGGC